jgi:hypothetical protein
VLAAVIGLTSELIDIAKQRREEVEARQRLSDDLQRQSTLLAQQAQALEQIDRTLNPLDDFVLTCEFSIPLDQDKVREYGQRVLRGWPHMGSDLDVNLVPQLWPGALNESSVLTAVRPTDVIVRVARPGAKRGLVNEDLTVKFPGEFPAVPSARASCDLAVSILHLLPSQCRQRY